MLWKRKLSIKQEVFYLEIIFAFLAVVLFGGILCTSVYYLQFGHLKDELYVSNETKAIIAKNISKDILSILKQLSNGELTGVPALDRTVEGISDSINKKTLYESQYSFIIDEYGKILVHPEADMIQKKFTYFGDKISSLSGDVKFIDEKKQKWAFYTAIEDSDFYTVTVVDTKEVFASLYYTIFIIIVLGVVLAPILVAIQGTILNRRISVPLTVLGNRIKKISNGEKLETAEYTSSNSEIAEIAQEIENIAMIVVNNKEEKLRTILFSVTDAVIATDSKGIVTFINPAARSHINLSESEIIGRKIEEVFDIYSEKDNRKINLDIPETLEEEQERYYKEHHVRMKTQSGIDLPVEYSLSPIRNSDAKTTGMVIVFRDYTNKKKKEEKMEFMCYHDTLTGVHNRRFFDKQVIALDNEENLPLTIIYADINGLKLVNDLKGHIAGDKLITLAARSIKKALRTKDELSRLGGDEFGVVLPQTSSESAEILINRIKADLEDKKVEEIPLSISFGYATKHSVDEDIKSIIKASDSNMYRNKIKESLAFKKKAVMDFRKSLKDNNEMSPEEKLRVTKVCDDIMMELDIERDT